MTSQRRRVVVQLVSFALVCGLLAAFVPRDEPQAAVTREAPLQGCTFAPGAHGAFRVATSAWDTRAPEQKDTLHAVLSWVAVERPSTTSWRLRAALSGVQHTQTLTLPAERVTGALAQPFFVDVDEACRFVGFGFDRGWSPPQRQLVQTLLTSWEHVLPADATVASWRARQHDGLGAYEARYDRRDGAVTRSKAAYEGEAAARALGLSLTVVSSLASARFERGFLGVVKGHEHVRIEVSGQLQAELIQRFSAVRDDARFLAVPDAASADADFSDAFAFVAEREVTLDPALRALGFEAALHRFVSRVTDSEQTFAAARELAAWLRAHPAEAAALTLALKNGRVSELARPALFLAFELSGTDESRAAVSALLEDPAFSTLDRARAASALSDLGTPTREVAELLRAQGQRDGMVGNVGLLGLGNLGRRANDDGLRGYVRETLAQELSAAESAPRRQLVLDAMGNSRDPHLADAVAGAFDAPDAATRRHAAAALGRMPGEVSTPRLLARLDAEQNPDVAAAMVRALDTSRATPEVVRSLAARLEASTSVAERAALIAWLGAASGSMRDARDALASHFTVEADVRLQQQIGVFLPASALR